MKFVVMVFAVSAMSLVAAESVQAQSTGPPFRVSSLSSLQRATVASFPQGVRDYFENCGARYAFNPAHIIYMYSQQDATPATPRDIVLPANSTQVELRWFGAVAACRDLASSHITTQVYDARASIRDYRNGGVLVETEVNGDGDSRPDEPEDGTITSTYARTRTMNLTPTESRTAITMSGSDDVVFLYRLPPSEPLTDVRRVEIDIAFQISNVDANGVPNCTRFSAASPCRVDTFSFDLTLRPDYCSNIAGVQTRIPAGYVRGPGNTCVRPVDECPNLPGVQTAIPDGYTRNGAGNCVFTGIACDPGPAITLAAGSTFTATARFTNNTSAVADVVSVTYSGTFSGTSTNQNIAVGDFEDYTTQSHTMGTGSGFINWLMTVNTPFGQETISCTTTLSPTIIGPECIAGDFATSTNQPTAISISIENRDGVDLPVNSVEFRIPGIVDTFTAATPATPFTVPPFTTQSFSTTVTPPDFGTFQILWQVNAGLTGCSGSSDLEGSLSVTDQPYVRFYGNDIVTCGDPSLSSTNIDVNGGFDGAPSFDNFRGSASQLAVMAAGTNGASLVTGGPGRGLLPGALRGSGANLGEFAFANIAPASITPPVFGGEFEGNTCSGSVLNEVETVRDDAIDAGITVTSGFDLGTLNGIGDGFYYVPAANVPPTGRVKLGNNGNFSSNDITDNIIVVVDGDLDISNDIAYRLGPWNITDTGNTIPSLKVYVTGNIYIEFDVTRLDGHYVAGGEIHTCAAQDGEDLTTLPIADAQRWLLNRGCQNKLSVNGSLRAERVHFLRTNGTIFNGTSPPREGFDSPNIAEAIRFSPEQYLLQASGGLAPLPGNQPPYDSIIARPPSF